MSQRIDPDLEAMDQEGMNILLRMIGIQPQSKHAPKPAPEPNDQSESKS